MVLEDMEHQKFWCPTKNIKIYYQFWARENKLDKLRFLFKLQT